MFIRNYLIKKLLRLFGTDLCKNESPEEVYILCSISQVHLSTIL